MKMKFKVRKSACYFPDVKERAVRLADKAQMTHSISLLSVSITSRTGLD